MSVRCRLGWHDYQQVPMRRGFPAPWLSDYTNTECSRCGKRIWLNWPMDAGCVEPVPTSPGDRAGSTEPINKQDRAAPPGQDSATRSRPEENT